MSEQTKDETKIGGAAAIPNRPEAVSNSEKSAGDLAEDELSKISAGLVKPHPDSY
jgi:hypothetical protein